MPNGIPGNHVPIAVFGRERKGEAASVALGIGGAALSDMNDCGGPIPALLKSPAVGAGPR